MQTFENNVINTWREKGKAWLLKLTSSIEFLSEFWSLTHIKPVNNLSWNYVALAMQNNNPVVLKISCDKQLIHDEYNALQHFDGHGSIKVLAINREYNSLLLEQAIPGNLLKVHHPINIKDTINIYADVVKKISSLPLAKIDFTHVSKWCETIDRIEDPRIERRFVDKAKVLRDWLLKTAQNEYLCHGDLHLENIIQQDSKWLAIDPKGIIGEMAFEAAKFNLLNKSERESVRDLSEIIIERVTILSNALGLDFDRLLSWMFLRNIINAQWFIEDNGDPSYNLILAKHIYPLLKNIIIFHPLKEEHLELLHQWFQEPIVKKWYACDKSFTFDDIQAKYLPRIHENDKTPSYIIHLNNKPIGFIQYYALCDHLPEGISATNNKLFEFHSPEKVGGLDIFIADANYRNKGLGIKIIRNFIDDIIKNKFEIIIVDPSADNIAAIRCYKKCGFKITKYSETQKNIILTKEPRS